MHLVGAVSTRRMRQLAGARTHRPDDRDGGQYRLEMILMRSRAQALSVGPSCVLTVHAVGPCSLWKAYWMKCPFQPVRLLAFLWQLHRCIVRHNSVRRRIADKCC